MGFGLGVSFPCFRVYYCLFSRYHDYYYDCYIRISESQTFSHSALTSRPTDQQGQGAARVL